MKKLTQRQLQAINTKLKITRIAIELYKKKGVNAVTVQDICAGAELSVGAFYHHFKSKEDIFNTTYEQIDILIEERITSQVFTSASEKILALFTESSIIINELGWSYLSGVYKNLFGTASNSTLKSDRYFNKEIKASLIEGMASGEFLSNLHADHLTDTMMRLARGAIFDWCLREGGTDLQANMLHDIQLALNTALTTTKEDL